MEKGLGINLGIHDKNSEKTESTFESLLNKDSFYQDIKNLSEAASFKKFLQNKWESVCSIENQAENNYRNNPKLQEYVSLQNKAYNLEQFILNNLDYGSEEANLKKEEMENLEGESKLILEGDPELKKLEEDLANFWNKATKNTSDFIKDTDAICKIRVIDKVLIPYFEYKEKANYLENTEPSELEKTRNELYILLDLDLNNKDIERRIENIEAKIKNLPTAILASNKRLELMKENLSDAVKKVRTSFY